MKLITDVSANKQRILIITKHNFQFVHLLKEHLKKFDIQVFVSPEPPDDLAIFSACIFINELTLFLNEYFEYKNKKFIFILFNQLKEAQTFSSFIHDHKAQNVKVINLETSPQFYKNDIDSIFWFSFSRSDETFLHIYHPQLVHKPSYIQQKGAKQQSKKSFSFKDIHKKHVALFLLITVFFIHVLFIPPLLVTTLFNYQAVRSLQTKNIEKTQQYTDLAESSLAVSNSLYQLSRPTLLLFSVALYSDNFFQLNTSLNNVLGSTLKIIKNSSFLSPALFEKDKTPEEQETFFLQKENIIAEFEKIRNDITIISQKIPTWNESLRQTKNELAQVVIIFNSVEKLIPHLDSLFARNDTKQYLLLFANNMELRPGGGFIGSFALVTVKDYTIQEMKVYDVYDADGQLEEHVSPPVAIANYLDQPHWFLRDSAFSPDFYENYLKAQSFLEKELDITDLDGSILLTTSAIQNLLEATGDIYLPDFRETINKDNFYIKTQIYTEKDFFPGSLQKKRFLSSLMNQLLLSLEKTSPLKLVEMTKKSLDEKQMVVYFDDENAQEIFDDLYWSGRTLKPTCANVQNSNCVVDYLFPVDANLGVNKANFFITKPVSLKVNIDNKGKISNQVTLNYKNSSFADVFPGGNYKNYLQILLPLNTTIKEITQNDTLVETYDEKNEGYKIIGFLSQVDPQKSAKIKVTYELPSTIQKGNGIYQLILQKQIGSPNSDFQLDIHIPDTMYVVKKNFAPLVKERQILYNTTITSDKIFVIEFYKE